MNAKFSTKRSYDALRGLNWLDVVPRMLKDTRQHFIKAKFAIDNPKLVVSQLDGVTQPGLDIILHNCNVGAVTYKYMEDCIMPICRSKPVQDGVGAEAHKSLENNLVAKLLGFVFQLPLPLLILLLVPPLILILILFLLLYQLRIFLQSIVQELQI
jgi:hypothetical protein